MKSKMLGPRRMVVLGFLCAIVAGTGALALPFSAVAGQKIPLVDSLFTATSAVCVTGLACIDPGTELSGFGQAVLAILIQAGGLGIASIGIIAALAVGGKFGIRKQRLLKEGLNLSWGKDLKGVVRTVLHVTILVELAGAFFSYLSFSCIFSTGRAMWVSLFHSIASFNNAGFDILGNYKSLGDYRENAWLCLVTSGLAILGGLGFSVIHEALACRHPRQWSLHTKVVLSTSAVLLAAGTLLLKAMEERSFSWLDAFFHSASSRTAGFSSVDIGGMTKAGLLTLMALMFIGASPGSTGGGIKTTTCFVLLCRMQSIIFHRHCHAFRRQIPEAAVAKAFLVFAMAAGVIFLSTLALCALEPDIPFEQIFFEAVSGFSTTGLSMGITPHLSDPSKIAMIITMFVGRLGPLTMATIWLSRDASAASYSEEDIAIG